jgi:hypothetical protein
VMMNRRIPKPIPRGWPRGPVLPVAFVLTRASSVGRSD